MDKGKYQAATDVFNGTLNEFTDGWANEQARSVAMTRLTAIAREAEDMRYGGYFSGLYHELETFIDALYSPRKHLEYKRDSRSGVEVLHSRILSCSRRLGTYPGLSENFKSLPNKTKTSGLT